MTETQKCPKCSGTGTVRGYRHIDNGVCFRCGGDGLVEVDVRAKARREAAAARRQAKAIAKATGRDTLIEEATPRYLSDERIGPETRAQIAEYPDIASDVVAVLMDYDAGRRVDIGQVWR